MKNFSMFLFGILLVSGQRCWGKDYSGVDFVTSFSTADVVRMSLVNPDGLETGVDLAEKRKMEIPNSTTSMDSIDNDETGEPASSASQSILLQEVKAGSYKLFVSGNTGSKFNVSIRPYANDGSKLKRRCVIGIFDQEKRTSFTVELNPKPGSSIAVKNSNGEDITESSDCE